MASEEEPNRNNVEAVKVGRRRRAWWQWIIGVGLLGAAGISLLLHLVPGLIPLVPAIRVTPRGIHVSPDLKGSEVVPAKAGELAGFNVLFVTLDTTRADRLGCYGNRDIETPNLDQLAQTGVLFSNAFAPAPVTLPSHSTMMTGRYPQHHGVHVNALSRLESEERTLAEVLADAGYATAAFVSAFVLDSRYGIDQGFATYDLEVQRQSEHWAAVAERPADETCARAISWLRAPGRGEQPFFLWVHFFDPHWAYAPPEPYAERYKDMLYDGEIAFADAQFGKLLEALDELGSSNRTLVVVAGDHGEALGQHEEATHGTLVYDSTLHVPLLMRFGEQSGGGVCVSRPVGLVDLMPTVLTLLGMPIPGGVDGVDLTRPPSGPRTLFFETFEGMAEYGWAPYLGVQQDFLKYIHGPESELYDLERDPLERRNLIAAQGPMAAALRQELEGFYGSDLEAAASLDSSPQMSPAELAKLQSLGYVFGGATDDILLEKRLDAKKMTPILHRVSRAFDPGAEDWLDVGIAEVENVVREYPDFYVARKELGIAYAVRGDLEAAEAEFRFCLELRPDLLIVKSHLAQVKENQGYFEAAIHLRREVLEQAPNDVLSLCHLGALLLKTGVHDEAREILLLAHRFMPHDVNVALNAADALIALNLANEAIDLLGELLRAAPHETRVRTRLTRFLKNQRRHAEAVMLLREGLELEPDDLAMATNLAINLAEWAGPDMRHQQEAVAIMERVCDQTGRTNAGYVHALGRAYAQAGRLEEAINVSREARRLAADAGQTRLAGTIDFDLTGFIDAKAKLGTTVDDGAAHNPDVEPAVDAQDEDD